ncbi:hypothetical protein INT44_008472 [Umbelopsis vinacea]|uniref:Uncharacterized protein n=1 Tax=Umbelopsis vinacea TaxID=44442 RepID=A0A8H7UH91_9FUNG|nr:hypothetical protein INT44_008472 [Umbelopsis vinacea]
MSIPNLGMANIQVFHSCHGLLAHYAFCEVFARKTWNGGGSSYGPMDAVYMLWCAANELGRKKCLNFFGLFATPSEDRLFKHIFQLGKIDAYGSAILLHLVGHLLAYWGSARTNNYQIQTVSTKHYTLQEHPSSLGNIDSYIVGYLISLWGSARTSNYQIQIVSTKHYTLQAHHSSLAIPNYI